MDFELPENVSLVRVEQSVEDPESTSKKLVLHFTTSEGGPRTLTFKQYSYGVGDSSGLYMDWQELWKTPVIHASWGDLLGQVSAHRCNPRQLHLKAFKDQPEQGCEIRGIYCRNCGASWGIAFEHLHEQAEQFIHIENLDALAEKLGWVDLSLLDGFSEFDPIGNLHELTPEEYLKAKALFAQAQGVVRKPKERIQLIAPDLLGFTRTSTQAEQEESLAQVNARLKLALAEIERRYTERRPAPAVATPIQASRNEDFTDAEREHMGLKNYPSETPDQTGEPS